MQEVESILGASNARVEALRIKSYYEMGNISEAKQALNRFSSFKADETLTKEISPYIVKIEEKEEYNRTHTSCSYCYGSGKEEQKIACGSCNGMGTEKYYNDCSWCKGSGRNAHGSECVMCGGDGKGGTQYRSCSSCQGSGSGGTRTKTCTVCYGKGDIQIIE